MMTDTILVTDSVFINVEHVKRLEQAGFAVERLDKPRATEQELMRAVRGKVGYILGGVEAVTPAVLDAADRLRGIAVAAAGYQVFVPAWRQALAQGIAVTNTPGGPTNQVAEWALGAALLMNRRFLELGLAGELDFAVTPGLEGQVVGVLGLGRIGGRIGEMVQVFRPARLLYNNRHRRAGVEAQLGANFVPKQELFAECDVVFVCLPDEAQRAVGQPELAGMKEGALLVNITHPGIIDEPALYNELASGRIRAVSDYPMTSRPFAALPRSTWYSNKQTNTLAWAGVQLMSDMATQSMLNLLTTGHDQFEIIKKI